LKKEHPMANERPEVQTGAKRVRPWTVMVYMAAGDSAEMDDYAVRDLLEMQRGANEHVHVAVQIKRHWPEIPQRYVITPHRRRGMAHLQASADPHDTDMGNGETLVNFLEWALEECPAHHYMLVLWGHAYGLGFGRDHGDPLRLSELVKALTEFRKKRTELDRKRHIGSARRTANGRKEDEVKGTKGVLDILGANACAMSYVEAAYELRNSARYLLASQIYVPFAGWPYDAVLQSIGKETTPVQLGSNIVDSYVTGLNNPLTDERVQMSLLDLSHASALRVATEHLASAIRGAFKSDGQFDSSRRAAIRDAFLAAAAGDVRPLVDLKDLSRGLKRDLCDPQARALIALTNEISTLKKISTTRRGWLEASAEHLEAQLNRMEQVAGTLTVRNAFHPSLVDLGGVGIYVPFVTDEQDLKRLGLEDDSSKSDRPQDRRSETSRVTYEDLALFSIKGAEDGVRGTWPALVYDDLNDPIPSELVSLIADIGVTGSADRAEIAQIVLSIESTFNKLDRVLELAETVVMRALRHAQSDAYTPEPNAKRPFLRLMPQAAPTNEKEQAAPPLQVTEPILLDWFRRLESALEEIERTTRRGLTQARFGLGPVASPRGFEGVKHDEGAPSRDEPQGFEGVKHDEGPPPRESTIFARADLVDGEPKVRPAFGLFRRAADALRRLEQAAAELERQAGGSLGREVFERRALGLRQAFGVLCETATSARRTIRRVIANPLYGLGPGAAAFDRDDREELANAAGMSARNLLLLNVSSLAPEPDAGELIYEKVRKSALAYGSGVDAPVPGKK
jgi:hypothetical protein